MGSQLRSANSALVGSDPGVQQALLGSELLGLRQGAGHLRDVTRNTQLSGQDERFLDIGGGRCGVRPSQGDEKGMQPEEGSVLGKELHPPFLLNPHRDLSDNAPCPERGEGAAGRGITCFLCPKCKDVGVSLSLGWNLKASRYP